MQHDPGLAAVAVTLSAFGSWVTARLYHHAGNRSGLQATTWYLLTALIAAVSIWGTHFVAMLGYRPHIPVSFDLPLTFGSIGIAVLGSGLGILLSTTSFTRFAPAIGGAVVGLGIAGMHYAGMIAYRVQGVVYWDYGYLAASIVLAVMFGALAFCCGQRGRKAREVRMTLALMTAIVSLHFTGMTAMTVEPLDISGHFVNPAALRIVALAIAGAIIVIFVGALFSYIIENRMWKQSVRDLIVARNAAENASRAKSEFLSILSHELRTPLTIVLGYSSFLGRLKQFDTDKPMQRGAGLPDSRIADRAEFYGEKITEAATHLLGMINEILDYTSMELGDTRLNRTSFALRHLLENVRDTFASSASQRAVAFEIHCDGTVAHADYQRCRQILVNLVGNALKHSRTDRIALRGRRTEAGLMIEVEDRGCGIPTVHQDGIFDAFQQVEAADNRAVGGVGMGLAICKVLTLSHGGTISLRSAEGEGATFTVSLPRSAVDTSERNSADYANVQATRLVG